MKLQVCAKALPMPLTKPFLDFFARFEWFDVVSRRQADKLIRWHTRFFHAHRIDCRSGIKKRVDAVALNWRRSWRLRTFLALSIARIAH